MTKRLTVQKVTTVIRKTGIGASHTYASRIRGMSNVSYGTKVRENGNEEYSCSRCHGVSFHNAHCTARRSSVRWNRRVVGNGTFTVSLEYFSGFMRGLDTHYRAERDSASIESALTEAGLEWRKAGDFKWLVTGYAEPA